LAQGKFGHAFSPFEIQDQGKDEDLGPLIPKSFEYSRTRFLTQSRKLIEQFPKSELHTFNVPSQFDSNLFTDVLYLQSELPTDKLLVILTGVHGGEAYLGNAQMWTVLSQIEQVNLEKMSVVFVHSLNPFGMKYFKRTTENNIDLNRNFAEDQDFSQFHNQAYEKLHPVLNESAPVEFYGLNNILLLPKLAFFIMKESKDKLTQATAGGQYQFPQGIFYGGSKKEPQVQFLISKLKMWAESKSQILLLDLHTGYGERGRLHLFGSHAMLESHLQFTNKIFADFELNLGGSKNFYKTNGDTVTYFSKLWPDKQFAGMCLEMGTRDSQETWGSFVSLQAIRLENQGVLFGYQDERDFKLSREVSIETFLPSDSEWRAQGIAQFKNVFNKAKAQFEAAEK
jgi:hypothetical protein